MTGSVPFGPEHLRSLERAILIGEKVMSVFENCSTENALMLDDLRELRDRMQGVASLHLPLAPPAEPHP